MERGHDQASTANTMDNDDIADTDMATRNDMAQIQHEDYNDDEYEMELERRLDMGRSSSQGDEDVDYDGDFKELYECKWLPLICF